MRSIFLVILSFSLIIITISVVYYFVIFLPKNEKVKNDNEGQIRKLQQETSDLKDSVENINNNINDTPENNTEDIQSEIQNKLNEERQNESNCESNGGRYKGNGLCVYY